MDYSHFSCNAIFRFAMFKTAEKVQGLGIVLSVLHYLVCNIFFAVFYPPLLKLNVNYHCYSARISSRDQIFFFFFFSNEMFDFRKEENPSRGVKVNRFFTSHVNKQVNHLCLQVSLQ